jgi:hypothetical protein
MLHYFISYFVEIIISVILITIIYQVFLSDFIAAKRLAKNELDEKISNTEKIARVKLVFDSAKDIEDFITNNAQYLSNEMVKILVCKIEEIKANDVVESDSVLKDKINQLEVK